MLYCIDGIAAERDIGVLIDKVKSSAETNKDGFGFFDEQQVFKRGVQFGKKQDVNQVFKRFGSSKFIVSHARWATTGKVIDRNAHPFMNKRFIWLHNGVMSNHDELAEKYNLEVKVDSEVICGVLHHFIDKGVPVVKAIKKMAKELLGSMSVFLYDMEEHKLYYYKHGSVDFAFKLIEVGGRKLIYGSTDEDNLKVFHCSRLLGFLKRDYSIVGLIKPKEDMLYIVGDAGVSEVCELKFKEYDNSRFVSYVDEVPEEAFMKQTQYYQENMHHPISMGWGCDEKYYSDFSPTDNTTQYNAGEEHVKEMVDTIEEYIFQWFSEQIELRRVAPAYWQFICDDKEQERTCDSMFARFYSDSTRRINQNALYNIYDMIQAEIRAEEKLEKNDTIIDTSTIATRDNTTTLC